MANMVTDHLAGAADGLFNNNNHLKCRQCGGSITDAYAFNVHPDVKFHPNCLKCSECGCFFQDETSCYIKNELPYCKDDYQRLFAEHCPKCEMPLNTNDMVQKVKNVIFHQECFSCSLCARPFSSGDEFLLTDLRLFCRQCHEQELDHHGNGVRNGVRLWERKRVARAARQH